MAGGTGERGDHPETFLSMVEGTIKASETAQPGQYYVAWAEAAPGREVDRWTSDTRPWPPDGAAAGLPALPAALAHFVDPDQDETKLGQLGQALHAFLLGGSAGQARAASLARAGIAGLRTWLQVSPSLAPVPWELMSGRDQGFTFGAYKQPWVRWMDQPASSPGEADELPRRILLVVAEKPGEDALGAIEEMEAIEDIAWAHRQNFDLKVLGHVSDPDAVCKALHEFRPHVLHIIAHGGMEGGQLVISFPGKEGQSKTWSAMEVVNRFQGDLPVPLLVVLNVCQSSATQVAAQAGRDGVWSVAGAFLAGGVTELVSMQGDVLGRAAALFARAFYGALATGKTVDQATALGRVAMLSNQDDRLRQCSLPVAVASAPLRDYLPRPARPLSALERLETTELFSKVSAFFVNRDAERRQILDFVSKGRDDRPPRCPLVVLRGPSKIGKHFLATMVAESLAARGSQVRRVAVRRRLTGLGLNDTSWCGLLTELRCGSLLTGAQTADWLEAPLPAECFGRYDFDVENLCRNPLESPPLADDTARATVDARELPWPQPAAMSEQFITSVFKSFRRALKLAAERERHVLIFDEMTDHRSSPGSPGSVVPVPAWWSAFADGLFAPVARGELPNVTIFLLMHDDEFKAFGPHRMGPGAKDYPLSLPTASEHELRRLLRQLYRRVCPGHWDDPAKVQEINGYFSKISAKDASLSFAYLRRYLSHVFGIVVAGADVPNPFDPEGNGAAL